MKKIKLLILLLLINFCAYSQTIPEVPIKQFTQAGYLNSKYYPIGWSEDERYFALMILSESNYASLPEGHGFDFLVKDVITDKDAYIKSYSGYDICEGKFDAYGQGECDFSAKGIFELHKATFTEALNKYNINTKTPLTYSTFPIKNAEGESISIQNYKVENDGYISMETLTATNDQQGSKTILQSTYDSNFRRLASEIVGAFVSPSKERLLVIQKYSSSGIEGDRDIELNFIGCHTQKGYQFKDVVESKKAEELVKSKQLSIDSELIENYLKENNIDATKTDSGLYYEITKKGTGANVSARDNVTVHYTGMLLDGEVFDSSLSRNKPLSFDLGRGMVIRGWDEGITYFNKGAEGKLYIPSLLGYGAAGAGAVIPPNAVLIFEIQVLDCGECEDNDKPINSIMEDIGSWDNFISGEKIDLMEAYWVTYKFLTANGFLNEGLFGILEKIFDTKVFLSGPHYKRLNPYSNDFGRYNPEFIKKLITTTEEILSNPVYLNLIRPIYKNHLEDLAITYQATYELFKLFKTNFPEQLNENTKIYLEAVKTGSFPIEYRRTKDKFGAEGVFVRGIEIPDYDYYKIRGNSSSYYPSLNFWGRRNIDGTNELFSELLDLVIEKIDDDKVDISNAPIKKDRVDISDHAYVIATNVNIRNKPNVSESKVLFQLNKVEWVKYTNYPDSAMIIWTGFDPTPVEIIDSTVTDGNKWYKIKGAKLTKEEIDNLSKWGDWDTVRDSLFNLDDMGNKIRQDNNNREHWIYHTLVHRFQNNSFKDGKYSASKVAEATYKKDNYKKVNDYVNFTIDGYNVKGELGYHPSEMDRTTCDIYGYKSADGKHLNLKSTCYSEGETYEGGTYQITLMDNNAFKLDFTSSRGNFAYNFYRYEFDEDIYAETKFKRGQYKVFLNEIDEQAAAGAQNKNDYVNITEIILNISDDINGIYSYFSWGYDSQSCKFSSGETKNENTVGFTLECSSEGNKYDAGSYSIEIIDESTLRWKSDDGRFEKVFNYTFIPEENENKYLVTNNNFGLINSKTTINDLKTIFGEDNVKVFDRYSCAGEQYRSYYVETEDVEFYIDDYYGGFWIIYSSNKKFQTEDGLGVGSNKTEIEKFNGQSIDICWDYDYENPENNIGDCYCEGQVESYNGGIFVEGIGIPWKSGIDFEFSYINKDLVVTKIKYYLQR